MEVLECTPAIILPWSPVFVQLFNHQVFDLKNNYNLFLTYFYFYVSGFCVGRFLLLPLNSLYRVYDFCARLIFDFS